MASQRFSLEIDVDEDEEHTEAVARLLLGGNDFTGTGLARRNPADPNIPTVGEDLAVARALADLSHRLIEAAVVRIESFEGRHVSITE